MPAGFLHDMRTSRLSQRLLFSNVARRHTIASFALAQHGQSLQCRVQCHSARRRKSVFTAYASANPAQTTDYRGRGLIETHVRGWQHWVAQLAIFLQAIALALALVIQISHLRAISAAQEGMLRQDATVTLLLVSLTFGFIYNLYSKTRQKSQAAEASLSASGSARLARVEVLQNRQIASAAATDRDLGNARTRLRILTKDIQPAVRQLQAENSVQAEALAKLSERLQSTNLQVEDTRQMLGALQGVAAKQLQLVIQALELAKGNNSKS